jgi:cation transport ATPase
MESPNLSRYRVPAMDCAAEEQLVRMGLDRLDGIGHVSVDLTERIVTVVHVAEADDLDQAMSALGLGAELVERGATDGEHASVTDDPGGNGRRWASPWRSTRCSSSAR